MSSAALPSGTAALAMLCQILAAISLDRRALRTRFTKRSGRKELLADAAIDGVVLAHHTGGRDRCSRGRREVAVGLIRQMNVIRLTRKRDEAAEANAQGKLPLTRVDVQPSQGSSEHLDDRGQMLDEAGLRGCHDFGAQLRSELGAEQDGFG